MNSAAEPLCDKCSVNGSVDCPPRLNLSYFPCLRTQIILRIHPINRPPVVQTAHSLLWLCLCAQSPCLSARWAACTCASQYGIKHARFHPLDNKVQMQRWQTDESATIEDEKTIRCRAVASGGSQGNTHRQGKGTRGIGQGWERLSTPFFGMLYFLQGLVP